MGGLSSETAWKLAMLDFLWFSLVFDSFENVKRTFCEISLPLVESLRSDDGGGLGDLGGTLGGGFGRLPDLIFFDFI